MCLHNKSTHRLVTQDRLYPRQQVADRGRAATLHPSAIDWCNEQIKSARSPAGPPYQHLPAVEPVVGETWDAWLNDIESEQL